MIGHSLTILAALFVLAATPAGAAGPGQQAAALHQFKTAVQDYTALHRQLEQRLPPPRVTANAPDVFESSDALAATLQAARVNAREGDIFTADVARYLRNRISETLTARGFLPEDVVAASLEEADPAAPVPEVNGRFPWGRGAVMWPCILDALPRLPAELQYRIIGRDLVLVDTHAELVVDILRNAI
jgi:hypothetical protein